MDQKSDEAFWDACVNGDFATVCVEIKKGADINYQNGNGRAGLIHVAKRDYKDIVHVLLDNGAEVNLEDNKGKTAIVGAAKKGNKTICKKLIKADADVNASDDRGRTALMRAAFPGHDRYIEVSLDAGAEINTQNEVGKSVLMEACAAFKEDVIRMLIERNMGVNPCGNNDCTASMCAACGGYMGFAEDLLTNGADKDLVDEESHRAIHYIHEDCLAQLKPILKQEIACTRDCLSHEVRNVVVLRHIGIGKTAVTENVLYFTEASDRFSVTNEGSSLIDYDPKEIRRGISVYVSPVPIEWKGCKTNFIDTPEHTDFIRGAEVGITVGDSVLTIVDAKDIIQPGMIKAWEAAQGCSAPTILFVNKLDEDNASFDQACSVLRETLDGSVVPFGVPITENGKTTDSVNILRDKAWYFEGPLADPSKAQPIPEDMTDIAAEYKNQIVEAIAMSDDELMEKYFSGEEFSEAELTRGVRLGVRDGEVRSVFSRNATHGVGTERLMDLIVRYSPAYGEAESIMVSDTETKEPVILETGEKETLCAQVLKTVVDPLIRRTSYIKVLAGVMSSDSVIYNAAKDQVEKIPTVLTVKGKHQTAVGKLFTGDTEAVTKLQATQTSDTSCEKGKHYLVGPIQFSELMLGVAVFPNSKDDKNKVGSAFAHMTEEDSILRLESNKGARQTILYGIGDQYVSVIPNELENKYKVEVRLEIPKIPYHETVRKTAADEGRHKRQPGGHGQFGYAPVEFTPSPDEEEMVFEEKVSGGAVPRQYSPAVETGLRRCMQHGLLAGYKVVNIKVILLDGKYHDVDSSEVALKLAVYPSYKTGIPEVKPTLLKPIVSITVRVPDEFTGTIIGDFNRRREAIMGMDMVDDYQEITIQVPLAGIQKYPIGLRAVTQGCGVYTQSFDRHEPVPPNIAGGIIVQHEKEEEE